MNIPIFLASDENYAKYLAVVMTSIFINTESFVEFYILDGGLTEETKSKIQKLKLIKDNFSIEFIKPDMSKLANLPNIGYFSLNTYLRYLIPNLKPKLNKVLYLDVDLIVNGDIKEFYGISLENYHLGACPYLLENNIGQVEWCNKIKNIIGLNPKSRYFNAGVLLIDCEYFREHNLQKVLIDKTLELANILECPDQDVLNIIFENNYKVLPSSYNLVVDMISETLFDKYKNEFFILHYTGGKGYRPWINSNCPFGEYFWKYAKITPFYQELLINLSENDIIKNRKNKILNLKYHIYKILNKITQNKIKFVKNEYKKLQKKIKGY